VRDLAPAQNGHFLGCRRSEAAFLGGVPSQAVLEIASNTRGGGLSAVEVGFLKVRSNRDLL
jgi:hypothetical protein